MLINLQGFIRVLISNSEKKEKNQYLEYLQYLERIYKTLRKNTNFI